MYPAPSVILFTVLSGLGFGLLTFLGLGFPAVSGWFAFIYYLVAFGLSVGGLLASTFHLGNPQRALKAFTQWRSSWLSREGWLSVTALLIMAVYAFAAVFFDTRESLLGWIGAALSVATVYATSMIYAQLRTVPRWNHPLTPVYFLSVSMAGGAILSGQVHLAIALLTLVGLVQIVTWIKGDGRFAARSHTIETATGLGNIGKTRMFEAPHTGSNYLLKEMVYVVGRKHANKLRVLTLILMSALPVILLSISGGIVGSGAAVISHLVGTTISRWLFFAEAEHVVGLYYGQR